MRDPRVRGRHANELPAARSRSLVVSLGVAVVCLLAATTIWPTLHVFVLEQFVLPLYYQDFGFQAGELPAGTPDSREVLYTFVAVAPGGRLSLAGARTGDTPMDLGAFHAALRAADAGGTAAFDVVALPDWPRRERVRRIVLGRLAGQGAR
jgi:hypothetical protein